MDTVSFSSELFTDNTASAMTQTANEKTPTFEEAMAELEALVRKMEEGKLALEESVEAYTRGTELVNLCRAKLEDAETRVRKLEAQNNGRRTADTRLACRKSSLRTEVLVLFNTPCEVINATIPPSRTVSSPLRKK